jgi:hypothetical protein
LAGDGSHSTDQPSGRGYGHGTGRAESFGGLPEQKLQGKAEYPNTQQGLRVHGIYSHVSRLMKACNGSGFSFSGKAMRSRSLISTFSFQVLVDYPF